MSLPSSPTCVSTNSSTDMIAALVAALFQLGGLSIRFSRACFFSWAGVSLTPPLLVRPRASTTPAAFPRCLVRRLRLVWAMVLPRIEPLFDRCAVLERDFAREVGERALGGERDELGG